MKKVLLLYLLLTLCFEFAFGQAPSIQWAKCFGGSGDDEARSVLETYDGGYVIAGYTESNDGDVFGNHGTADFWVIKIDSNGNLKWQKCLGGTGDEESFSIKQTADSGFIIAGHAFSDNGDVTGIHKITPNFFHTDYWVVKTDSNLNIQWQKCLGGTDFDWGLNVEQTMDGGFIVTGYIQSNDGDVTGYHGGYYDGWVIKLNNSGNIQWGKSLGGIGSERIYSTVEANDGGYIFAGWTSSNDGDVSGNHGSGADVWLVKLDTSGKLIWQGCFGGSSGEVGYALTKSRDGGFLIAGNATSNDGDVFGRNNSFSDAWLINVDSTGTLKWQKCFCDSLGGCFANAVATTTDGGIIIAGQYTNSTISPFTCAHGNSDFYIVKSDSLGNFQWSKCLGGIQEDVAYSIRQTRDGGYIVVGSSFSNDGDVTGNHGGYDYWVVKLSAENVGIINPNGSQEGFTIYPNPFSDKLNISLKENEPAEIILYDITSRKLLHEEFTTSVSLNTSQLSGGLYFYEVRNGKEFVAKGKVVKE